MKGERMRQMAHNASPFISIANLIGLLTLIAVVAIPGVRLFLRMQLDAATVDRGILERVSANEAVIISLDARQDRLEQQMRHQIDRSDAQYRVVNNKLDQLLFMLAQQRRQPQ